MKLVALDTNVLIDFRLKREPNFPKARKLLDQCLNRKVNIFIPKIVLAELEWVLRAYYKEPKEKIIIFLEEILIIEGVTLKDKHEVQQALILFKRMNIKFTDALIFTEVINSNSDDFLTFDKDLNAMYKNVHS